MNIPIIFTPINYNNNYYLDGALLDPFPYYYHKNTKKIGFWLFDNDEFNMMNNLDVKFMDELPDFGTYTMQILKVLYTNYVKKYYKKIPKNVISINFTMNNVKFEDFNVLDIYKKKMFNIGVHKSKLFIKKMNKKARIKYLSMKYFNLWIYKIKIKRDK